MYIDVWVWVCVLSVSVGFSFANYLNCVRKSLIPVLDAVQVAIDFIETNRIGRKHTSNCIDIGAAVGMRVRLD